MNIRREQNRKSKRGLNNKKQGCSKLSNFAFFMSQKCSHVTSRDTSR